MVRQNNQKWKQKFRNSCKWKEFRNKIKKKQKIDPITGQKLSKSFNLHHMFLTDKEEEYTDISNEDNFIGMNSYSHKVIHYICTEKDWKKRLLNLIMLVKKMAKINGYK